MMRRRHILRRKDAKKLLQELSDKYGKVDAKKVETAEIDDYEIIILDDVVELVKEKDNVYPFLGGSLVGYLPKVVVDMGAIWFVCNGADVMAPGITEMDDFEVDDLVVIRDMSHGKALAVGKANQSSQQIHDARKGKVIKNLHYVGDGLWESFS